jgi:glycosyltransferase involved in cell wall biosynthesis
VPDLALANSAAIVHELRSEGFSHQKVKLIYNGVKALDPNQVTALVSRPNNIVCVANLIPYKGHVDLIKAFSISYHSCELPDLKLYLVGRVVSSYYDYLLSLVHEIGLADQIHFVTECSNPSSYLLSSRVAILPSHQEGFSNSLLEYMAARLPIVATSVGGNNEAIIHMKNGLITPPADIPALADCILVLLRNPLLAEELANQAYADSLIKFSDVKVFQKYRSLYNHFMF